MDAFSYDGINRHGKAAGGQTPSSDAAHVAEGLWKDGWREAKVRRVGNPDPIGGVERHPDTNQRTWWGEFAPGH